MSKSFKIGVNQSCPCGSGNKYKHCCHEKIPWSQLLSQGESTYVHYLSPRGRNILFIEKILAALQIDKLPSNPKWEDLKKALTPEAIKKIYEAIMEVWPPDTNLNRALSKPKNEITGFYTGNNEVPHIYKAIKRHCLYTDKILIADPLIYPISVREEFNPILNPKQYRTTTLRYIDFWFSMIPWIDAGLIEIVRTPSDFDTKLNWDNLIAQKEKFDTNKELKKLAEDFVNEKMQSDEMRDQRYNFKLLQPDSYFVEAYMKDFPDATGDDIKFIHEYLMKIRDKQRYFMPPLLDGNGYPESEFHIYSMGSSYIDAKQTSAITNSYLLTDMPVRWKEIEFDRERAGINEQQWSPFAKAFQQAPFKCLENVDLESALLLRKENRLEKMRLFFRTVWLNALSDKPFSEDNIMILSAELDEKIREAEYEWSKINRDLLKFAGVEFVLAMMGAGPLIKEGYGAFVAAATAGAGITNLLMAKQDRKHFKERFPAGFFLNLQ